MRGGIGETPWDRPRGGIVRAWVNAINRRNRRYTLVNYRQTCGCICVCACVHILVWGIHTHTHTRSDSRETHYRTASDTLTTRPKSQFKIKVNAVNSPCWNRKRSSAGSISCRIRRVFERMWAGLLLTNRRRMITSIADSSVRCVGMSFMLTRTVVCCFRTVPPWRWASTRKRARDLSEDTSDEPLTVKLWREQCLWWSNKDALDKK